MDDCHASYRRKDHLTRHLLQHQGKLFKCPIENCNREFTLKGNMTRHVTEQHDEVSAHSDCDGKKQYVCKEIGCGKVFKYASKLRKHEESHVSLDSVEAFCAEPGCMKYFTNKQCLQAHVRSCHEHITCEICGSKQLRKNIKRHLRMHESGGGSSDKIKCNFKGCGQSFATGDFVEADEQFRSRPRGGRKRNCPTVEMLIRKRVCPPSPNGSSNVVCGD